jgi:hypothetical protein
MCLLYAVIACSGMLPSTLTSKPALSAQFSAERRVRFMASSVNTARESSSAVRDQLIAFGKQLPQPGVRGPQPGSRLSQSDRLTGRRGAYRAHAALQHSRPSVIKMTRRADQRQSPETHNCPARTRPI